MTVSGAPEPADEDAAGRRIHAMWAVDPAPQALGVRLVSAGAGRAVLAMTVRQDMTNSHGVCHGGYIFTLADTAFAYACNSGGGVHLAAHAAIEFIAPARVGDELTATSSEDWRQGRAGVTDVVVENQKGDRIAMFRGRSQQLKDSP